MDPIVYRGMTQAELDSVLDNQRHVPDVAEWIADSGWILGRLSQLGLTTAARQRQAA